MADLLHQIEASPAWRLCAAAAIGLLIGIERERQKNAERKADAGLRSFTLVSLMGGLAAQTGAPLVVGAAMIFAAVIALMTRMQAEGAAQGLTTQVALVIAAILGVLAQERPGEALAAAVIVVLVISSRVPLHRFAREWLTEQEVRDGLLLAVAALVVLPLLPDRAIDPLGLANPFALWRLAVVLMGVSAFSHFAFRILGPRYGLAISGFAGGFVSSTATIAAMGRRASGDKALVRACTSGAVASILGSLLFLAILVAAADPEIIRPLVKPLGVAAILTLGYAALMAWRTNKGHPARLTAVKAFDFRTALIFVGLVSLFSLLSWVLIAWAGDAAIYASVVGTALIDAHAAAVSIATLVAGGKLAAGEGAFAILAGFSVNMLAKAPAAFALGHFPFGMRVTLGLCVLVAGLWIGYGWDALSN
jgi:uncharacterized membrane protein (DUF4010 family)